METYHARGPYYWVRFVQRILELLTDLCIGYLDD